MTQEYFIEMDQWGDSCGGSIHNTMTGWVGGVQLYAKIDVPEELAQAAAEDDPDAVFLSTRFGTAELKDEIIKQAVENGINPDALVFI